MQDMSTGALVPIENDSQEAQDRAIPQRENQGPVFGIGEIVEVKGGRFKVHAISDKRLYLDSLPANER